jgi:hypothetical protein
LGYQIRTTADTLFRKVFTRPVPNGYELSLDRIMAVFYITEREEIRRGQTLPRGTARHVTPAVGVYTVLHADAAYNRIYLTTAARVRETYEGIHCRAEWRELDPQAAEALSKTGEELWGVDDDFGRLLELPA